MAPSGGAWRQADEHPAYHINTNQLQQGMAPMQDRCLQGADSGPSITARWYVTDARLLNPLLMLTNSCIILSKSWVSAPHVLSVHHTSMQSGNQSVSRHAAQ